MVVIYLVRRLSNVERTVKRTLGEVRHQVTPDDLHTAFGQWVEANPARVTTACAPYIDRSVAVAADVIRARVVAAAPPAQVRATSAPPPPQQQHVGHARVNDAQPPSGYQQSHGGAPLGQHAVEHHKQQQHHHHQPVPQQPHSNHHQGIPPLQHRQPHPDHQQGVLPVHAQVHHPQQQQHTQPYAVQQRPPAVVALAPVPLPSHGHGQGAPLPDADKAPIADASSFRQHPLGHGRPPVSPHAHGVAHRAPGDPVETGTRNGRPNVRCEGDVCVVIERPESPMTTDSGAAHRPWIQATPAAPSSLSNRRDPLSGGAASPRPEASGSNGEVKGAPREEARPQHDAPARDDVASSGSLALDPLPAPDCAVDGCSFGGQGDAAYDHSIDDDGSGDGDDCDGSDSNVGKGRDGNDGEQDDAGNDPNDDADLLAVNGDDDDDDDATSEGDAVRNRYITPIVPMPPRHIVNYGTAARADDPWSLPDEPRFFIGRGDESDDDDDAQEETEGDAVDGPIDDATDDDQDPGNRYPSGDVWYGRPIVSAPVFLVLRASDNGIGAPSGSARIVPLDDDDDDGDDIDNSDDDDVDSDDGLADDKDGAREAVVVEADSIDNVVAESRDHNNVKDDIGSDSAVCGDDDNDGNDDDSEATTNVLADVADAADIEADATGNDSVVPTEHIDGAPRSADVPQEEEEGSDGLVDATQSLGLSAHDQGAPSTRDETDELIDDQDKVAGAETAEAEPTDATTTTDSASSDSDDVVAQDEEYADDSDADE
nr:hypothetical protein [Pandoravirus massiliensis]